MKQFVFTLLCLFALTATACADKPLTVGAERTKEYLPELESKRVAVLANHTAMAGEEHLVDMLVREGINVVGIFSPEHGFRGGADAGEHVKSSVDEKTGIPIWSLYDGKSGRPSDDKMQAFDVLLVDMQDVGLRFYTYYISMLNMINASADFSRKVIVLDRPNPNGMYVDGPILNMEKYKSGVGALPIPVVHGLTMGEIALMAQGEGWSKKCDVEVVTCEGYTHQTRYDLPIAPSPNLPTQHSIYLYPSTCLFEGTVCSLGRGTSHPFECYGHPDYKDGSFTFTPRSVAGAKNPPLKDVECYGVDLRGIDDEQVIAEGFNLEYVIDAYNKVGKPEKFFTRMFLLLTGVDYIKEMIIAGNTADEIRARWQKDVEEFKVLRRKYLLYEE
ncbi:MAG: DUF1343 domain-containing protein [Alistipes sp.]|nr:DUF1343 domain-containing protein [Alistipes sp.]MBR2628956.1 DUF1343 domain-containing protein [Alistipes sp.]